jgi:glyoxylase-like metal-dependent hydrolase (beta-lactamase superfamily II)
VKPIWLHAIGASLIAIAVLAVAQEQDFSKVEIRTEKLSATTYMLTGAGGNIGVSVGEDNTFIIDDQFAPLTPRIEAAVAKLTSKPIRFVVNTHWHFDHTGGNENFGKAGAVIVAHENVRKRMSTEQLIEFLGMKFKMEPRVALPALTFTRDLTFHQNGDEIHIFHVANAHTDGDAIVHFRTSDVIHMGDVFFNGLYPFIDTSSGGTIDGVVAAADRVLGIASDATRIIPGHGPLAGKADLKAYRDMLVTVATRVREGVQAKRSLEEVIAAKPTADFDARFGKGFLTPERFIEMVYKGMAR